jgi:hypothetical protein
MHLPANFNMAHFIVTSSSSLENNNDNGIIMSMKIFPLLILWLPACYCTYARQAAPELTAVAESQLEEYARAERIPEDDTHWQQLQAYTRRKMDLNAASAEALRSLGMLSPLQIDQLLLYRQQMGKLISIYELQAVPGFDAAVIGALLPYVQVGHDLEPHYTLRDYVRKGEHALLLRYGRQGETGRGYEHTDSTDAQYTGSPDRLLLRYRYNFPRYISWGTVMEKDAGEAFFKGAQRQGFDFYSLHLFVKQYKCMRTLALGDFTVNMGQGLLNWQSLAFGKGAAVMQVKREGELLKPYASAGEFNFYRGAGITMAQGKWQGTAFISSRQLDGSITNSSGYHRTAAEIARRHSLSQLTTGGNVTFENSHWKAAFNFINHHLSAPVQKGRAPYQLFNFEGDVYTAVSADYEASWKQVHFFGECAVSGNGKMAWINGMLASVAARADLVVVLRHYSSGYHSFYADAWGEFYKPANESGIYTGICLKINTRLQLTAYADRFRFPWLQYRLSAPGGGQDMLTALTYCPDKQTEVFVRYHYAVKLQDGAAGNALLPSPVKVKRQSWRIQTKFQVGAGLTVRNRAEVNMYQQENNKQQGFLLFQEWLYNFSHWPLQLYARYTHFVTGGNESRIYTVTSGMLYEYALSQLNGEGEQYQVRVRWKFKGGLTCWLRYQMTVLKGVESTGTGWDEVKGNRSSTLQCQWQHLF